MNDQDFSESTISSFSSTGPTIEGRIKPDIISPGSAISSAHAADPIYYEYATYYSYWQFTCTTHQLSGTSMATPLTAGTALLVRQYYENSTFWQANCATGYSTCVSGAFSPSGYLVKATILHSGEAITRYAAPVDDLPVVLGQTPDIYQGYGYVTLSNVLPIDSLDQNWNLIVHDNLAVAEGETMTWEITVPDDGAPLRVTISWYDVYAEMNGNLIHNLDLKVVSPSGIEYYGNNNVFGGDEVNPNEQVKIDNANCENTLCIYTVVVSGISVTMADVQSFAIVMTTTGSVGEPLSGVASNLREMPSEFWKNSRSSSFETSLFETAGSISETISKIASLSKPFRSRLTASNEPRHQKADRTLSTMLYEEPVEDSIVVDVGTFTLDATNFYEFSKDFTVSSDQDIGSILFQFTNWESVSHCPIFSSITIEDSSGNTASFDEWPWNFASCYIGYGSYTLGYYSHLAGTALSGLAGSGTWSVTISWMYPDGFPIDFDMSMTLSYYTPNVEYRSVSQSIDISLSGYEEKSYPVEVSIPEWNSGCYQLSHVATTLSFVDDGCNVPMNLLLSLTDPSSRGVGLLPLIRFDWFESDSGNYYADDLVESAQLQNGGIYTVNAYLDSYCPFSNIVDFEFYFRSSECMADEELDTVSIPFDVSLSSCYVLVPSWIGDGWCDYDTAGGYYNSPACAYDGGDCCEESCESSSSQCGANGYDCQDPEYACVVDYPSWIGDGWCDGGEYNTEQCGYDGGDCCEESCNPDAVYDCGISGYECIDPEYADFSMSYSASFSAEYTATYSTDNAYSMEASAEYVSDYYSGSEGFSVEYSSFYSTDTLSTEYFSEIYSFSTDNAYSMEASVQYVSDYYSGSEGSSVEYSSFYSTDMLSAEYFSSEYENSAINMYSIHYDSGEYVLNNLHVKNFDDSSKLRSRAYSFDNSAYYSIETSFIAVVDEFVQTGKQKFIYGLYIF